MPKEAKRFKKKKKGWAVKKKQSEGRPPKTWSIRDNLQKSSFLSLLPWSCAQM